VKRYINQPKRRAPITIRKKRERAYFIWLLLSDLRMRDKSSIKDHGEKMAF
jgi:hypothetical protein